MINKPKSGDFPQYFNPYIELIPKDASVLEYLERQQEEFVEFLNEKVKPFSTKSYEEGKWNCQELLGHLIDTERILAFRAFFIARADQSNFPGFEQDDYVDAGDFMKRDFDDLVIEFSLLRANSIQLFKSFPLHLYERKAKINGFETALAAMPFIMGGHVAHHQAILKERYIS